MVGSMHLGMTIYTSFTQQQKAGSSAGKTAAVIELALVEISHMTLLTQEWRPADQESRLDRAVRLVAFAAVLRCGLMLKYEWPPFFLMAGNTGFYQARLHQIRHRAGPVGIVAVRADGFAFFYRVA
jgi:hypothetical protein